MANQNSCGGAIRVLVTDTTPMGTQLILEVLRQDNHFDVVGTPTTPDLFAESVSGFQPHVVIIGVGANGNARKSYALLRRGLACCSKVQAVMLLDSSTHDQVVEAFRSGARGVICRDVGLGALRKCIDAVNRGQIWANSTELGFVLEVFSQRWVPQSVVDSQGRALLSKRELDVVRCVSEGMTNRDIASHLGLSEHTVKNYIFRTFDKLGVSNRAELILYAINHGCLQESCPHRCEECTIAARIELPAVPAAVTQPKNGNLKQDVRFGDGTVRRPRLAQ
jgi:two-component system nitrate/nitrite response regulator NarL